jgi:hypothetical protein
VGETPAAAPAASKDLPALSEEGMAASGGESSLAGDSEAVTVAEPGQQS